ncbi:MAG: terpene cyclase/mutase family protein [Actinobacteria bacterium]|nr:terpene cyclase/mutase family protein [Actinomycetota bacterium]
MPASATTLALAVTLAAALIATLTFAAPAGAITNQHAVKRGVKYINKSRLSAFDYGFKADALSALAAARKFGVKSKSSSRSRLIVGLENDATGYVSSAGSAGKVALAAVVAGRNPRCFGSDSGGRLDLISSLEGYYDNGQYGTTSYDQAFAMLALKAAHERVPKEAVKFVKKRRGKHGWGFGMSSGSGDDVQSTALIIQALRAAGVKRSDGALQSAYKWIRFQRNSDLGYNPDGSGAETNANATALVIQAADALGKNTNDAKRALRALQQKNGAFKLTPTTDASSKLLATMDPVLALSGRHYPVVKRSKAAASCF